MVLGVVLVGGLVVAALWAFTAGAATLQGGSIAGAITNRLTKSEERRVFELQREQLEYNKSQRGLFQNIGAFFFGEQSIDQKQDVAQKELVNAVHTGTRDTALETYTPSLNPRSFRMKRGRSVFG